MIGGLFGRATSLGDRRLLCRPTLWCQISEILDRKLGRTIGEYFFAIRMNVIGGRFGRATSLGDRRLLCRPTLCCPISEVLDRKFGRTIGGYFLTIRINMIGGLFGRAYVARRSTATLTQVFEP